MSVQSKLVAGVLAALSLVSLSVEAANVVPTPKGHIAIHYSRPDGQYAPGNDFKACDFTKCWGVHAWGDAYDADTSWFKPPFPNGIDDFGAYWHLKANEDKEILAGAAANYIIHKAQLKEQGGKDMQFEIKDGMEIFIVSQDCKIYFKLEDAMAAKANPKNDCKEFLAP